MKQLIIIRGPSGSGKTTAAKDFVNKHGGAFFEADGFFYQEGNYVFDPKKLPQAHGDCQRRIREALANRVSPVVVSNTSMTHWEMNPYFAMAKQFEYHVTVYRIGGPWDAKLFASRNVHGVTEEIVQRQINKYEPLENEEEYYG